MTPEYQLGINHHLLFPETMVDPEVHRKTLPEVLAWPEFSAVDLFVTDTYRSEEIPLIRNSGKHIVYNTPGLIAIPGCNPNAIDLATVKRTQEAALSHIVYAFECGAGIMNIASGLNPPADQKEQAWKGWVNFLSWFTQESGRYGIRVVIEPFDQSIGKNLLIGPTVDAVRSVETVRKQGGQNLGLMVDMAHLPIMGETFSHAIRLSAPYLWHVHLGNAVIRDPAHPWYGDCHPPLDIPEGEHTVEHLSSFLSELKKAGYFQNPEATLTFEMRPYKDCSARDSIARWLQMLDCAWQMLEKQGGE